MHTTVARNRGLQPAQMSAQMPGQTPGRIPGQIQAQGLSQGPANLGRGTGLVRCALAWAWLGFGLNSACESGPASGPMSSEVAMEVSLSPHYGGQAVNCANTYEVAGRPGQKMQLRDFRMFVSGVELHRADTDTWNKVKLDTSLWQRDGIALLDFEDATQGCAESGTPQTHTRIQFRAPRAEYDGIRFDIGIPFAQNHVDPTAFTAPLDNPGMFWTWQGGYKFVRVDWTLLSERGDDKGERRALNFHLGSTGCDSLAPTMAPASACRRPNRGHVELMGFDPMRQGISIDVGAWFGGLAEREDSENSAPGCMSQPGEELECEGAFAALGMSFATGDCLDGCKEQKVFRVAPR